MRNDRLKGLLELDPCMVEIVKIVRRFHRGALLLQPMEG